VIWEAGAISWLLGVVLVNHTRYFVPLALGWEDDEDHVRSLAPSTVARVRQQANVGVLADATADEGFCRHVVKAVGERRSLPTAHGKLVFTPTEAFAALATEDLATLAIGRPLSASTNTAVQIGERLFLKTYRRLRPGLHPELELGRFLTEKLRFPNCVPLAGAVEYLPEKGEACTVMLLQGYVANQGDGWSYTLAYLERYLETQREGEGHAAYLVLMQTLAARTAELHRALATRTGDPAFDPEPASPQDVEDWKRRVREEAEQTFTRLEERDDELSKRVSGLRSRLIDRVDAAGAGRKGLLKTRHHGDYHLGQVLIANNDFYIIDFEGEPGRPLAEARRKHSPLRDVAGMLRSFSYAKWSALMNTKEEGKEALLDAWESETRRAFLAAYGDADRGLIELFEIEKVLYELRYELDNRPNWVHIPLHGIAGIAARA
jgi:maltose alpha-D-glucosyltransferase / alpha-amylase